MIDPRAADHAVGLELQIEELVEQRQRAVVQGRHRDADSIGRDIAALQAELADYVEKVAAGSGAPPQVGAPPAEQAAGDHDPTPPGPAAS